MTNKVDYDAVVVGAGFAGLALIHHLKKTGISVKVLDKASEIGGTWTWNRYPGAATDSEGYYYCLTFSKEIYRNGLGQKDIQVGKRQIGILILLLISVICGLIFN